MQKRTVQEIFQTIATKINKPYEDLLPFIKIFKENWFETEEDLIPLQDSDYEKLKVPYKIIVAVKEEIKKEIPKKQSVDKNSEFEKQLTKALQGNNQDQKTEESEKKKKKKKKKDASKQIADRVNQQCNEFVINLLYVFKPKVEPVVQICSVLEKIHENLAKDPYEMKYKTLKKSNKTVQNNILIHDSIPEFLKVVGFAETQETFYAHTADIMVAFCIQRYMHSFVTQSRANLEKNRNWKPQASYGVRRNIDFYQDKTSYMVNLEEHFKSDPIQQQKQIEEKNQLQALESLAAERQRMLKEPPKDRQIRIYPQNKESKIHKPDEMNFEEEFSKSDNQLVSGYWKEYIKANQNGANFRSKRKVQLQHLLKQKIHTRSLIRIKLPNNYNIEAFFSPYETLRDVLKLVQDIALGEVYLFTAPPRVVMKEKQLAMTLHNLQAVPTGTFHLGSNGKLFMNKDYKQYMET